MMKTIFLMTCIIMLSGCESTGAKLGCSAQVNGYYSNGGNIKPRPSFDCQYYNR